MENKNNSSKISFTALGLVFGTAVGVVITIAIGQSVFWAGIGTGTGLIIGAILELTKRK